MRRGFVRLPALVLCLALLCSCGVHERTVVREHSEVYTDYGDSDIYTVRNYAGLKNAIWYMVMERIEYKVLRLYNFGESVGTQISEACMEVQRSTPIGAYAVDYFVTPGYKRIVSYYDAEIRINYRVSEEQMAALEWVPSLRAAKTAIENGLDAQKEYMAYLLTSSVVNTEYIADIIDNRCHSDPFFAISLPSAEVALFPDEGDERIVEVQMSYAHTGEEYEKMKERTSEALVELLKKLPEGAEGLDRVRSICDVLAETAEYDSSTAMRYKNGEGKDDSFTLYGTVCGGRAVGEGYAETFALICSICGLDCDVIVGYLDGTPHAWNCLNDGERAVYIDCSMYDWLEDSEAFDMSDEYMALSGYQETGSFELE